jgi:hypothetical protein
LREFGFKNNGSCLISNRTNVLPVPFYTSPHKINKEANKWHRTNTTILLEDGKTLQLHVNREKIKQSPIALLPVASSVLQTFLCIREEGILSIFQE